MIRALKETDTPGLNSLSPQDWNFDYEGFLNLFSQDEYFYAFGLFQDGKIIGTGNVFLKGKVGWLANIIVDEKFRGRGYGMKMTVFLIDFLESKGCETQLLIATELGEPVYQKVGFKKITEYYRFDTEITYDYKRSNSIRELVDSDLKYLYELDKNANDEDRIHLLNKFSQNGLGYFSNDNELLGFYLPEFGQGLIISINQEAGKELLKLKHSKKGRKTMLPMHNQDGINFLMKTGLKAGNRCSRMVLGKQNNWTPEYIYSYAGGYCG